MRSGIGEWMWAPRLINSWIDFKIVAEGNEARCWSIETGT